MVFKTWLDSHERIHCCSGEREENLYKITYDKKGVKDLIVDPDFKHKTYEEIQSHRDSCDIEVILKRYENGDVNALNRREPMYIDNTIFPENYVDFFNMCQSAKDSFYALSPDVRDSYNNSVEQYLAALTSFNNNKEVSNDTNIESEVSSDES